MTREIKPIGSKQKIGTTDTLSQKMKNTSFARSGTNSFYQADTLMIDPYIEEKYGSSQGKKLAWKPIREFAESFGSVDGFVPVVKDEKDKRSTLNFANSISEKTDIVKDHFVKRELVLAEISIDEYNAKQEYELSLSRQRRSGKADSEVKKKVFSDASAGYTDGKSEVIKSQMTGKQLIESPEVGNKKFKDLPSIE